MTVDKHALALASIVGSSLDVLGALYLAYDLLGGEHGPLRTLTRGVTYSVIYGLGFGLTLGPVFGIAGGVTHGITLAWEYSRASEQKPKPVLWQDAVASVIRGLGYVLGAAYLFSITFGIVLGTLSTVGQVVAYRFGIRPTMDYQPGTRPRLTKRQFWAGVNRTAGYTAAGYLSAAIAHQRNHALLVGLRVGFVVGAVTVLSGACTPVIEWLADHLPEKRMGVFGIVLVLVGFLLQSLQYWAVFLNVSVQ